MLSMLADGPKYGYEIIKRARLISKDQIKWSNSQLYPLLHRLTSDGHEALAAKKREWISMQAIFAGLWGEARREGLALG